MDEEPNEMPKFGFGILATRLPDGKVEYRIRTVNNGIPIELVLMQMRAFLTHQEKVYFDRFGASTL